MTLRERLLTPIDIYAAEAAPTPWRGWGLVAYACAGVLAAALGYFLIRVPLQVSDNVWNLITVDRLPFSVLLTQFGVQRPLLWVTLKAATEASAGHYFEVFRGIQIAQLAVLFVLVVRLIGVRTARDAAVVPLLLVVLAGFHTFRNLVQEAYPINTYLSALLYVAAALNLVVARPGWRTDALAIVLLAVAALTIETGLLVWVVFVLAYLCGSRSISRPALALATCLVVGYVALVVHQLAGRASELANAPTGFGFGRLEPQQVTARFGANPLPFWVYNVISSIATILFAEPRRGTWQFVASWVQNDLRTSQWLVVGATTATTLVILSVMAARLRRWLRAPIPPRERWLIIFAGVLVANATMSFAYTKDDIMSPSGLLYAVAVYAVVSTLIAGAHGHRWRSALLALPLAALAALWCVRVVDVPYALLISAMRNQTDWARIEQWKRQNAVDANAPEYGPFIERLQTEALRMHVPNPYLSRRMRVWDRNYSAATQ